MERGHGIEKANRTYQWIRTPMKSLYLNMTRISMGKYYDHVNNIMHKVYNMLPYEP
jgi:hypothetical protein